MILAASCLESTRLLMHSKSEKYPNGIANSSDVVGRYFSEHIMGPRATGYMPALKGTTPTNDDGRPVGIYIARFRNVTERHKGFLRGYGFQGRQRQRRVSRSRATRRRASAPPSRRPCAT